MRPIHNAMCRAQYLFMAGIYIHIPFCKKKCIYCDFYSIAANPAVVDEYVSALCREAELRKEELASDSVRTVYLGGGTPSLLSAQHLERLTDGLRKVFDFGGVEEFTIEVNPDDVSEELVGLFLRLGINRVSMGVQSFVDEELKFLNRRHDAAQAIRAYGLITSGGIGNVSIDLIYGIPGQTLHSWQQSLDQAMQMQPKHISCYNLTYEEGTRLYRLLEKGNIREVHDEECIAMYEQMIDVLASHGYEHYEISNFALPGYHSRHNSSYWDKSPYLGLGASAHSYVGGTRYYNTSNARAYISEIGQGRIVAEAEEESVSERYDEEVLLRLRTNRGIDAAMLRDTYGEPYYSHFMSEVRQFVASGLIENTGSVYRLSRKGVMLSDMVMRELMYV